MKNVLITFGITCIVFGGILMGISHHYDKEKPVCRFTVNPDTSYIFRKPYAKFYKIMDLDEYGGFTIDTCTADVGDVTIMIRIF